ncbi:MAG: single-stranded-DNA-specific exonuclease RecJ [Planctomycetia bacterium]|nr:single-stranded-DNA-specific exonuclease RecJ [Planctomycetia bacterium]
MPKLWRISPHDPERIAALERAARLPTVVARLLVCRGLTDPVAARDFLDPKLSTLRNPEELPGAAGAAERILRAVRDGERITVYGDYDVDGITATSLLWQCLKLLGANVGYYVPHRLEEGYGLNREALTTLANQGTRLVVTVDCGIGSIAEAEVAAELGLALVVTDHHATTGTLPQAEAIVHPRLPGHAYPFAGLSGAGVAFKLAWLVAKQASGGERVSDRMRSFLLTALGLAALGTVADVVPLVDENRVLVQHGLVSLKERPVLGLAALMRRAELHQKPRLDCEDVAFALAPRLNAAGRLGQAQLAVELLCTTAQDRAEMLAEYIDQLNGSRQSLERSMLLSAGALAQAQFDSGQDAALVLAERGWHPGVIGIVAGRLVDRYHRPVIMIALDELGAKPGTGSCRSIPCFDICQALTVCSHHLIQHGGHAAAAGLKIDEQRIDAFRLDFCEYAGQAISEEQRVAELSIDAEVFLSELTLSTVQQIERLAPFGQHNPRPLLCATNVTLSEPPKRIGGGERHLSLKLAQHHTSLRAVAFGGGEWADEMAGCGAPLSIAFRPVINEFRGRKSVELHVADWRAAQPAGSRPQRVTSEPTEPR